MKVSIIVPLYNKDIYVDKLMLSIVNQNFDDYEVIVVDDGSTDSSFERCCEWKEKYSFIKIYRIKNSGVAAARQYGVSLATGRYIVFVDADDCLLPDALKILYESIEETEADEVFATYVNQYGVPSKSVECGWNDPIKMIKELLARKACFVCLWGIIYKKEILSGCIDIPRCICSGEDILMQVKVLLKRPKVYMISSPVYQYTVDVPNNRRHTLETELYYDNYLSHMLANEYALFKEELLVHKMKTYEFFIKNKDYKVARKYYESFKNEMLFKKSIYKDYLICKLPIFVSSLLLRLYRRYCL